MILALHERVAATPLGQTICPLPLPEVKFLAQYGPQFTVVSLNAWVKVLIRSAKLKASGVFGLLLFSQAQAV